MFDDVKNLGLLFVASSPIAVTGESQDVVQVIAQIALVIISYLLGRRKVK